MKEQYVGDINDYRKLALLRHLSDGGRVRIGVCWMLTAPDDRNDGKKLGYLDQPEAWGAIDPELFVHLGTITRTITSRRLALVTQRRVIPGAIYFNEFVPRDPELRLAFIAAAHRSLGAADIIFYDPDNGVDVRSVPKGHPDSPKFLFRDEITATYVRGHSVLVYQHFPRESRGSFVGRLSGELAACAPGCRVHVFQTSDVAFFLIVRPEHATTVGELATTAAARWPASFMSSTAIL